MRLQDLENYINERGEKGLTKIVPTLELDAETTAMVYYVVKTKETYLFGTEEEADELINAARQLDGFESAKKKFKEGKVSKKTGEELTPDTWTVVLEINY